MAKCPDEWPAVSKLCPLCPEMSQKPPDMRQMQSDCVDISSLEVMSPFLRQSDSGINSTDTN